MIPSVTASGQFSGHHHGFLAQGAIHLEHHRDQCHPAGRLPRRGDDELGSRRRLVGLAVRHGDCHQPDPARGRRRHLPGALDRRRSRRRHAQRRHRRHELGHEKRHLLGRLDGVDADSVQLPGDQQRSRPRRRVQPVPRRRGLERPDSLARQHPQRGHPRAAARLRGQRLDRRADDPCGPDLGLPRQLRGRDQRRRLRLLRAHPRVERIVRRLRLGPERRRHLDRAADRPNAARRRDAGWERPRQLSVHGHEPARRRPDLELDRPRRPGAADRSELRSVVGDADLEHGRLAAGHVLRAGPRLERHEQRQPAADQRPAQLRPGEHRVAAGLGHDDRRPDPDRHAGHLDRLPGADLRLPVAALRFPRRQLPADRGRDRSDLRHRRERRQREDCRHRDGDQRYGLGLGDLAERRSRLGSAVQLGRPHDLRHGRRRSDPDRDDGHLALGASGHVFLPVAALRQRRCQLRGHRHGDRLDLRGRPARTSARPCAWSSPARTASASPRLRLRRRSSSRRSLRPTRCCRRSRARCASASC